jgi:hypothetical protein
MTVFIEDRFKFFNLDKSKILENYRARQKLTVQVDYSSAEVQTSKAVGDVAKYTSISSLAFVLVL